MRLNIFVVLLFVIFGVSSTQAKTIYVRSTGVPFTQCGMIGAPCQTVQQAIDIASDDDIIKLTAETYTESLTLDKNIDSLTIECGWSKDFLTRSPDPGKTILQSDHVNSSTLLVEVGSWGKIDLTVDRCLITGGNSGIAIVNHQGILIAQFLDNLINNNINHGIYLATRTGGDSNITISGEGMISENGDHGVILHNTDNGISTIKINGQKIADNTHSGIRYESYSGGGVTSESYNNFYYGNGDRSNNSAIFLISQQSGSVINASFTNDTITDNHMLSGAGLGLNATESSDIDVKVRNTILWGNTSDDTPEDIRTYAQIDTGFIATATVSASYSDIGVVSELIGGTYTDSGGNISSDPVFHKKFHLRRSSPLIDSAQCGYFNILTHNYIRVAPIDDFDEQSRPGFGQTSGCDIGADEYYPSSLCFPIKTRAGTISINCISS